MSPGMVDYEAEDPVPPGHGLDHDDRPEQQAPRCPYCDRVMSNREASEQGSCNDCYGNSGRESPYTP